MNDDKGNHNVFLFMMFFPFVVDLGLAMLLPLSRGRKKLVILVAVGYILLSFVLPIFLGLRQFPDQKVWVVIFVLLFRAIELFGLQIGRAFLCAWLDQEPPAKKSYKID